MSMQIRESHFQSIYTSRDSRSLGFQTTGAAFVPKFQREPQTGGHPQTRLTDSEENRKGMVGATGIEPMTSTVSR